MKCGIFEYQMRDYIFGKWLKSCPEWMKLACEEEPVDCSDFLLCCGVNNAWTGVVFVVSELLHCSPSAASCWSPAVVSWEWEPTADIITRRMKSRLLPDGCIISVCLSSTFFFYFPTFLPFLLCSPLWCSSLSSSLVCYRSAASILFPPVQITDVLSDILSEDLDLGSERF